MFQGIQSDLLGSSTHRSDVGRRTSAIFLHFQPITHDIILPRNAKICCRFIACAKTAAKGLVTVNNKPAVTTGQYPGLEYTTQVNSTFRAR